MQRKYLIIISIITFITAVLFKMAISIDTVESINLIIGPLLVIAKLLRQLSLTSAIHNMLAIVIYLFLATTPLMILVAIIIKRRKLNIEDYLLVIISISLFIGLYLLINPGLISIQIYYAISPMITSLILAYIVFKILRIAKNVNSAKIGKVINGFLYLTMTLFILIAWFMLIQGLDVITNTTIDNNTTIKLLQQAINFIAYLLEIIIINKLIRLLSVYQNDKYDAKISVLAASLSKLIRRSINFVVGGSIVIQALYLCFAAYITDINISINFPFTSLIFVFVILFIVNIIEENRQLKDDNDLFI